MELRGVWVPLITPFRNGRVDTTSLRRLCADMMEWGAAGVVPCGTTGEAPLLSDEERSEVIACAADVFGDGVIAGAGTMSTEGTLRLVEHAAQAGARAVLVISPFFMAATQDEIAAHYRAVADASPVPVVIYNFPARTQGGVSAATTLALSSHANIAGTKQSVPALDPELQSLILSAPEGFSVMVGGAGLLWPAMAVGAKGGILAAAHLEGPALLEIARLAEKGDLEGARAAHRDLWPRLAGAEGPAGIKRRLHEAGVIASPEMRPPLGVA